MQNAESVTSLRVDKWLHHVRVFKTRSLAAQACTKSNVKVGGQEVKPAREVRVGDIVEVERGNLSLVLRVLAFPLQRVGPPKTAEFYENLTPPENFAKAAEARKERQLTAPRSHETLLKPTKKDLRQIREWLGK
jgi:ribosome-associated heat shock protein Hsp15